MNEMRRCLIREQIIRAIRLFFDQQGFHEVTIPVLNQAVPNEPNIDPFTTIWKSGKGERIFFLPTSPERQLKKMLAQGIGPCYAIGPSFRNLENSGSLHAPEFLMLEWYRENADYQLIMEDIKKLIHHLKRSLDRDQNKTTGSRLIYQNEQVDLRQSWPVLSLEKLFNTVTQLNYQQIITDDDLLFTRAKKRGYVVDHSRWEELFDQILNNEIEPTLPKQPCFVTDFPARLSPLCQVNPDQPYLAERFEFYLFGIEIGNGNNENTDPNHVAQIINKDQEFIHTLQRLHRSGKKFAGVGIGLDRLMMIFTDQTQI